jgi:hypothetical protein
MTIPQDIRTMTPAGRFENMQEMAKLIISYSLEHYRHTLADDYVAAGTAQLKLDQAVHYLNSLIEHGWE